MTEGIGRTTTLTVGPAVAHKDTLLVFLVDNLGVVSTPRTGIGVQGMGGTIL